MSDPDQIEIRKIKSVNHNDFIRLYKEAGWWRPEYSGNTGFIVKAVQNSTCFVGAFKNDKMIGMGRALSDGSGDAYVHDVVVLKEYRRQGIGKRIVQLIVKCLKAGHADWIGLIGTPGSENFYKELGFKKMKQYVPMVLEE